MRADRLVSMMLLLQSRGKLRGRELAKRLEVSERTIYRDLDALSSAGVPVYAQRGPNGGVALLDGWRTSLTGLTEAEVQALAVVGAPGALSDIGLSASLRSGLIKLAASLPAVQQRAADHARQRLHIDGTGWFEGQEDVPHLAVLRDAVWRDRRVRLRYRNFDGKTGDLVADPYGLVIKVERWYLVAATPRGPSVFRGSRVEGARLLAKSFTRPPDFDLAAFWTEWCRKFASKRPSYPVTLRVTREGARALRQSRPASEHALLSRVGRGGKTVTIDFERQAIAFAQLVTLGPGVEVIEPPALRLRFREIAGDLRALYGSR